MIYCHECGEKISGNDSFCPFCGISLTPVAPVESPEKDISDENTIAVSGEELENLRKNAGLEHMNIVQSNESSPEISNESKIREKSDVVSEQPQIISTSQLKAENVEEEEQISVENSKDSQQVLSGENLDNSENGKDETELEDSQIVENFGVVIPENTPEKENEQIIEDAQKELESDNETETAIKESEHESDVENPPLDLKISSEEEAKIEDDWQSEAEETANENANAEIEEFQLNQVEENSLENENSDNNSQHEESNLQENDEQKIEPPQEPLSLEEDEVKMPTISYDSGDALDIAENKVYTDNEKFKSIFNDKLPNSTENRSSESEIQQNDTGQRKLEELAGKISIPETPLEQIEDYDRRYDSVKIMDDEPDLANESETVKNQAENSYTTPNFAGKNDTDGRKGLKLKPLEEGTVLNNRYEIIRKIGGGGMGAVYMATDKNLGETLRAVKEMVQSYIEESQQEKAIEDFKREATILSTLDHPAIPTIYDYFYDENEGRFYLVMKYISGGDLAQRLRSASEGRLDELSVVEWAIQVADVLAYLHKLQPPIVYRDLKPANVMLDSNTGRIMLIDFGIARSINKEEKGVTAVGTMGYAPPELFSGNVEARSDIYSLGSTMFHLLTGADPQSNPLLIFDFQKHPRPRQINPSLTDQIEKIIMRSVEYNANNRFTSAAELRDELIKHLRSLKAGKVSYGISESPAAAALEDQKVFCGFCGQQIVATDMFCAFCGSKQPLAQQGVHSSEYVSPVMTAKLFVLGTNDLGTPAYALEKDNNILGRRDPITQIFPEVDLSKFDPQTKISRRHARIWRENGKFLMEDLGSSNGTLIIPVVGDSYKLRPHNPHNLVNGEKVKVGDTTLHFVID